MKRFLVLLTLVSAAVVFSACSQEQVQQATDAIVQMQSSLDAQREIALASGDEETLKLVAKAQARLDEAKAIVQAMRDPATGEITVDSGVAGAGTSIIPVLPPPWNLVAFVAMGFAGWFGRQIEVSKLAKSARSIVNSIDVLRSTSPAAKAAMAENKEVMQAQLTDHAKAIIKSETLT